MKKLLGVFAILFIALAITGCGKKESNENTTTTTQTTAGVTISLDEYNKITNGMTYSEVKTIVGGECQKQGEQNVAGIVQTIYSCPGDAENSKALLTFQNDSLITKIQTGLK